MYVCMYIYLYIYIEREIHIYMGIEIPESAILERRVPEVRRCGSASDASLEAILYVFCIYYSDGQKVGNIFCNPIFVVTRFTYSEALSSLGFISTLFTALHSSFCPRGATI